MRLAPGLHPGKRAGSVHNPPGILTNGAGFADRFHLFFEPDLVVNIHTVIVRQRHVHSGRRMPSLRNQPHRLLLPHIAAAAWVTVRDLARLPDLTSIIEYVLL